MKKHLKWMGAIVCLIACCSFWPSPKEPLTVLTLENVEALASGEYDTLTCYGSGSVDCNGDWVYIKYRGLSLE